MSELKEPEVILDVGFDTFIESMIKYNEYRTKYDILIKRLNIVELEIRKEKVSALIKTLKPHIELQVGFDTYIDSLLKYEQEYKLKNELNKELKEINQQLKELKQNYKKLSKNSENVCLTLEK